MIHSIPTHDLVDLVTRLIALVYAVEKGILALRRHRRRKADRFLRGSKRR